MDEDITLVELTETDISIIGGLLVQHISMMERSLSEAYSMGDDLLTKDGDLAVTFGLKVGRNALEQILKHLPRDFEKDTIEQIDKLQKMAPKEAMDSMGKQIDKRQKGD